MLTLVVRKRGDRGFCFDDLVDSAAFHGATVGELAEWLAQARRTGLVETVVTDPAERTLGRRFRVRVVDYPIRGTGRADRPSTSPSATPTVLEPK
jgi:hypothetical protein